MSAIQGPRKPGDVPPKFEYPETGRPEGAKPFAIWLALSIGIFLMMLPAILPKPEVEVPRRLSLDEEKIAFYDRLQALSGGHPPLIRVEDGGPSNPTVACLLMHLNQFCFIVNQERGK